MYGYHSSPESTSHIVQTEGYDIDEYAIIMYPINCELDYQSATCSTFIMQSKQRGGVEITVVVCFLL